MSVTIKDIAAKVGVSVVTVSRALNDKPDISKETKKFILKIAKELNYTPNSLARGLVTRRTKTVGILIPNNLDLFYASVFQGIGDECLKRGYSNILCNTHDDSNKELEYIRLMREKRVDGMLIYPVQSDDRYIDEIN